MVSLNRRSKGLDSIKNFNRYLVEVGEVGGGGEIGGGPKSVFVTRKTMLAKCLRLDPGRVTHAEQVKGSGQY